MNTLHVKKGDTVVVISGKDKGKKGDVIAAYPKLGTVLIEGVNVVKRHMRGNTAQSQGQIVEKPMPINASNVKRADAPAKAKKPRAKKAKAE
jgi:large subunit ribosomal protein L24